MHQQPGRYGSTVKTSNHRSWALKPFRSGTPSQIATLFSEACGPPCSSQMWSSAAPPSAPMSSAASGSRRCPCWMPCRCSASPWTWAASMQPSWPWRMAGTAAWRPWSWWRAWPLRGCRHRYLGGGGFTYFFLRFGSMMCDKFILFHSSFLNNVTSNWAEVVQPPTRSPVMSLWFEVARARASGNRPSWVFWWVNRNGWAKLGMLLDVGGDMKEVRYSLGQVRAMCKSCIPWVHMSAKFAKQS